MRYCSLDTLIKRQKEAYHKKVYINFRSESIKKKLHKQELENKLQYLVENDYKCIKHTTIRRVFKKNCYSLVVRKSIISLTYYDGYKYYFYYTNFRDDKKNDVKVNPFPEFRVKFHQKTGISLKQAFGSTKQCFKTCVPMPLYYQSLMWAKQCFLTNVSKDDFSSHYPNAASMQLPNANDTKLVEGYVEPNEEYPFAFYPDTGHVSIYNEFNSRDYMSYVKIYSARVREHRLYPSNYSAKDTKTVLMKASKYDLKDEMNYYYSLKMNNKKNSDEYNKAKLFMNMFIGMFEQNDLNDYNATPFAHLAAVIKWRANIKMFKLIQEIGDKDIIQVCVDGIIHHGKAIGTYDKALGNLVIEADRVKFIQRGINQYILFTKEPIKEHAGLDVNIESNDIMKWEASEKIKFLTYLKKKYNIEEI